MTEELNIGHFQADPISGELTELTKVYEKISSLTTNCQPKSVPIFENSIIFQFQLRFDKKFLSD